MYMKKPANAVSSTEGTAAAISIDISSDEEDNGEKRDKTAATQDADQLKPPPAKQLAAAANGTKSCESSFNDLMGKMRPGPASQKKRRLDALDDLSTAPLASSASNQQQPVPISGSKPKKFKKEVYAKKSAVTFADVGGMDKALKELCELILHIKHPEMYKHIGLQPPRGFLLHGAPGCGKSLLAHAIAGQLDVLLIEVPATELVAGVSGESEERIREIFEQAASFAPCVLFIDEIDSISSNRQTAQKDMERRIVSQLLSSLDNLAKLKFGDQVLVIGATNRPESLDPALRRVGRFDHEISLGIPDRNARTQILQIISRNLKLERPFDFDEMAALTPGYVGADLLALLMRAASTAIKRVITDKEIQIIEEDLKKAEEKKPALAPIVNIDDDSLLMEVDTDAKKAAETVKVPAEEEPPATDVEKEPTTEEAKADDETAKAEDEKAKVEEGTTEVIEDALPEAAPIVDTPMDTTESPRQEGSIIEVIKKEPALELHLTLDNMLKWLQNDVQPLTDAELETLAITRDDFLDAVKHLQPSAKREGFITVPDVTWDDIGSLQDIRSELKLAILAPVKFPEKLLKLGLQSPSGVLLCGPPGCGKTLLAKAVANEAGINFISVKGPELLNMVRSIRNLSQTFN